MLFATCLLENFWHRFWFFRLTHQSHPHRYQLLGSFRTWESCKKRRSNGSWRSWRFRRRESDFGQGRHHHSGWQEPKKMWSMLIFFGTNVVNARFGVEQKVKYHKISCIICIHVFTFLDGKEFLILMQEIQSRKEEADRQSAICKALQPWWPWPMDDSWLLMGSRVLNL